MTRAFATPLPSQRLDLAATLAQPVRTDRALPDQESPSFAKLLREEASNAPAPDRSTETEPARSEEAESASRGSEQEAESEDAGTTDRAGTADEADPTTENPASQAEREPAPPRRASTEDTEGAGATPSEPSPPKGADQPVSDQPALPEQTRAGSVDPDDTAPVPTSSVEAPVPPKAPGAGEPNAERAATGRDAPQPEPIAAGEGARVELAPDAEAQAEESIRVETRFDAKIRDRIRNAAKVDLAALASEKLTTPDQRIPGDLRQAPTPRPQVAAEAQAETVEPREPAVPPPTPPASAPAVPNTQAEAPSSATRGQDRVAPEPPATNASATPANANGQQGTDLGARQESTPQMPHVPVAAPAAGVTNATSTSGGVGSFEKAIGALRSLGAERAKPGVTQAPQAKATPESRARPVLAQVSRGMASILRQQGGNLTLRLRPDTLGDLKISLRVQNGGVEATFKADNAQARELLTNSMSQLKETLEANGVRVDQLRVEHENTRPQDAGSPGAERDGNRGDGSPGFADPSETGGREGDSREDRHGRRNAPHGRGQDHDAAESASEATTPGLDAEALRDEAWIGLDTLA
ncbi:MAG: flagellar hook-length control protein FliK [Phycisphaerales bacterium JB059]